MKPLRVTNIQRGCVYDGDGVRTTVFLKGCSLDCPWCSNPEAKDFKEQFFIDNSKCLFNNGVFSLLCKECERIEGDTPIPMCPFGVAVETSKDYTTEELFEIIIKDEKLYKESNGGVTFSGGEPLLYSEEIIPLLVKLKERSINIAFETTLFVKDILFKKILDYIDVFIIDLKLQPQMHLYNIDYLDKIELMISNLRNKKCLYRMVFIDNMINHNQQILEKLLSLNINEIELLCCHNLGRNKYIKLGLENENYSADVSLANSFANYLTREGHILTKLSFV